MKKSKSSKSAPGNDSAAENEPDDFPVVGIGASAGGIQALKEFFGNVPADSGASYVVILHLSPEHESRLAEVLQTSATITVTQVTERVKVEPNHVYVVPPNKSLSMVDGHIVVSEQPEEVQSLLKDLLISVTNFFRDKAAFSALENEVVPRIVADKKAGDQIRVWVAGCATGEEACSLAMLIAERTPGGSDAPEIQIFASDIDETAIAQAREGFYTISDAADVSPERLRRFFTKVQGGYRVRRELRETVLFANHNVIKDPPFSRLDLATCRNMLIYLNPAAQKRVMETFHFALLPNGFLFLGASESIDGSIDVFAPVSKENNIFQSRNVESRVPRAVSGLPHAAAATYDATFPQTKSVSQTPESEDGRMSGRDGQDSTKRMQAQERLSYADLHQQLVEQYAPPSVVVNEDYDVLHLSERAGRFMQIQGGEPSNNLLKMIRPELRLEMRTALYRAVQKRTNVEVVNLPVKIDERRETINLHVRPVLRQDDTARGFILVIFEQTDAAPDAGSETAGIVSEPVAEQLGEELIRVKAQLRSSIEQYEIQAEELKASNEELQAINEELRSSTEELETGKEELQSINEELVTVNQELKIKIEELSQSNSDFQNLMASSDIGTIFLNRALRVKMFTPATRSIINLLPADIGRPLTDITTQFVYEKLYDDCEFVLEKLLPVEREIATADKRWFLLRILPHRTAQDQINGVVLTFLDITERVRREAELKELSGQIEQQARIFNTTLTGISDFAYIFDRDGRFVYSNKPLLDLLGITLEEIIGKNFFDLNYPEDLAARLQKQIRQVFDAREVVRDETPFTSPEGEQGFYEYIFTPVFSADGKTVESVAGSTRDVTERKRNELQMHANRERLQAAMNAGQIFSWEMNPATRKLEWSSNTETVIGFPLLNNIDKTFEMFHPDDAEATIDAINRAIETGGSYESEYRLVNPKNGETFYFHSQGAVTENTVDGAPRFVGITQNITGRKAAEETLAKTERRLRIAVEAAQMGTWTWDLATDKVIWNKRHFELFGMKPKQTISSADFYNHVHPDDRDAVHARLERTIKEKVLFEAEFRAVLDDGETRWMSGYGQVVEEDHNRSTILGGVMLDITNRKRIEESLRESEERSRVLIEGATDFAIFKVSPDNLIESWNAGAEKVFGWKESEIIGQSGAVLFTPEDRAAGVPEKERRTAAEKGRAEDERWHIRKDGTRFFASGVMTKLMEGVEGFVKIARDQTDKIAAEKAVREKELLQKLVAAQEDERKRIARDLHDELGQQLVALRLKLESVRKVCEDEKISGGIDEAQTLAGRIDDGVDFLAWELRPAALDDLGLNAALKKYVGEWSRFAGVTSEFRTVSLKKERLASEVETNLYRIAQEALNNTHKHAAAARAEVSLEKSDGYVVLIIEDDGKGFNVKNKKNRTKGIGLIGMEERAALIGGTFEIESAPQKGTTIFVRVPATFVKKEKIKEKKNE